MTKPLHPSELFAILERCLEKFDLQKRLDQAFEALQAAKNGAEGASRKTSEFLAKLTEELGVPMGEIMASAKVFTDEAWGPLGTRQYMDHALSIHDYAAQVLDTLKCSLDLAKAQAGTLEINEDRFDLAALMTWVVRLMKDSIDVETAEIELVLPDSPPMVWGDERHFERILINLLSNAVKFTPEDGRIEIGLETRGDGALAIEVSDTGIGMPPSEIPTALARFGRVDNPGGKKFPGAGLGLPLALAMAELHGGRLTLESEFGQGTVATVIIPAERVDSTATDEAPSGKADEDPGVGALA
jgi:two-component system cell cycle sensor histidine kinase PleC